MSRRTPRPSVLNTPTVTVDAEGQREPNDTGAFRTPSEQDPSAPLDDDAAPTALEFALLQGQMFRLEDRLERLLAFQPVEVQTACGEAVE